MAGSLCAWNEIDSRLDTCRCYGDYGVCIRCPCLGGRWRGYGNSGSGGNSAKDRHRGRGLSRDGSENC